MFVISPTPLLLAAICTCSVAVSALTNFVAEMSESVIPLFQQTCQKTRVSHHRLAL